MIESFDLSMVNWARAQFALTAYFHFLFVPLTLGMSFIIAIMETIYYKTNDDFWKHTVQFWSKLFGINFAIGVATGLILEFEFGTNWSNYSWFVGDIFGAPLAIEGIFAFFIEATFFAVMFFGWDRVSKGFHLMSTWMVAFGSNLSALWILVANGWMQFPIATRFNPDYFRNEMTSFIDLVLSPVASSKFLHTIASGYVASALFMSAVACWYLLRGRHVKFAKRSLAIISSFGLLTSLFIAIIGDQSGYVATQVQPMKMAAAEGLYEGKEGAGVLIFGIPNFSKKPGDGQPSIYAAVEIPYVFSYLGHRNPYAFSAGIEDMVFGNEKYGIEGNESKIAKGKMALAALKDYKAAKKSGDEEAAQSHKVILDQYVEYMGYGHFDKPEEIVPPVWEVFFSFHIMVALGVYFIVLFIYLVLAVRKNVIQNKKLLMKMMVWSWPLGWLAIQAGWTMAEVGRQPWAIQGLLPTKMAVSNLSAGNVMFTFFAFLLLFCALFFAEVKIMIKAIVKGPQGV